MHVAGFITIKLHEDVIPDLNEAITILIRTARRAARNMLTMIIKNLGARTAWAGITHHPKVIRRITRAFVIPNTNDAIGRNPNLVFPNRVGLIIFSIHSDQQFILGQLKDLGQ